MTSGRALILVDIQNDFVPGGALAVREGDAIVPIVNRLQERFKLIIASKDWHPRDHASFSANHPGNKVGDVIDLHGLPQVLWPVHCMQETEGAEFVPALQTDRIAKVFLKGIDLEIDSYSAFFDNGHRRATGLAAFLREHGVTDLFVVGLATDYCVKFTALDAKAEGFNVYLVEDACRGVNLKPGDSAEAIEQMRLAGVQIVKSDQVIALP